MNDKYAIIEASGVIEDGPYDDLLAHWNDEKYMSNLIKELDPPLKGDLILVKIMCHRH